MGVSFRLPWSCQTMSAHSASTFGVLRQLRLRPVDNDFTRREVVHRTKRLVLVSAPKPLTQIGEQLHHVAESGELRRVSDRDRRREAVQRHERALDVFLKFDLRFRS